VRGVLPALQAVHVGVTDVHVTIADRPPESHQTLGDLNMRLNGGTPANVPSYIRKVHNHFDHQSTMTP
jgi:hypothetical protein